MEVEKKGAARSRGSLPFAFGFGLRGRWWTSGQGKEKKDGSAMNHGSRHSDHNTQTLVLRMPAQQVTMTTNVNRECQHLP